MVTSLKDPPCSRCLESDRMLNLPDTTTDFGGVVSVWVCLRCGIVAISTKGGRPSKGGPAPDVKKGRRRVLRHRPGWAKKGVEISTPLRAVPADG